MLTFLIGGFAGFFLFFSLVTLCLIETSEFSSGSNDGEEDISDLNGPMLCRPLIENLRKRDIRNYRPTDDPETGHILVSS